MTLPTLKDAAVCCAALLLAAGTAHANCLAPNGEASTTTYVDQEGNAFTVDKRRCDPAAGRVSTRAGDKWAAARQGSARVGEAASAAADKADGDPAAAGSQPPIGGKWAGVWNASPAVGDPAVQAPQSPGDGKWAAAREGAAEARVELDTGKH